MVFIRKKETAARTVCQVETREREDRWKMGSCFFGGPSLHCGTIREQHTNHQPSKNLFFSIYIFLSFLFLFILSFYAPHLFFFSVCCWRSGTGHTGAPSHSPLSLSFMVSLSPQSHVFNAGQTNGLETDISNQSECVCFSEKGKCREREKKPKGYFPSRPFFPRKQNKKGSTGFPALRGNSF